MPSTSVFGAPNWLLLYLDWLDEAVDAPLDNLLRDLSSLVTKANTFQRAPYDADEAQEMMADGAETTEQLLGAAFVVCQVYTTNVIGRVHRLSVATERRSGEPLSCGGPPVWKQADELRALGREERGRVLNGEAPTLVLASLLAKRKPLRNDLLKAQKICREKLLTEFGKTGAPLPIGAALNAAANYWKHRDEWSAFTWDTAPAAQTTVRQIREMGLDESTTQINMTLATRYFGVATDSHDLVPLAQAARHWGVDIAEAASKELQGRGLVANRQPWVSKR